MFIESDDYKLLKKMIKLKARELAFKEAGIWMPGFNDDKLRAQLRAFKEANKEQ